MLIITEPNPFKDSPYREKANTLRREGKDVQCIFIDKRNTVQKCKCGFSGSLTILEKSGNDLWGECPDCKRPYIGKYI